MITGNNLRHGQSETPFQRAINVFLMPRGSRRRRIASYLVNSIRTRLSTLLRPYYLAKEKRAVKKLKQLRPAVAPRRLGSNIKRVLVLNPYFPTLGGGEKSMAFLCKFLENYYESASIDVLVFDFDDIRTDAPKYPTIDDLERRFSVELGKTTLIKMTGKHHDVEQISRSYDLFINHMFLSKHPGGARKNLYVCMFPPRKRPYVDLRFITSYDIFLVISQYTDSWMRQYWGDQVDCRVLYPPVFFENELAGRYQREEKKNIILAVGRFQVDNHNKKQHVMIEFFSKYGRLFSDWELHLVGGVSGRKVDLAYVDTLRRLVRTPNIFLHVNASSSELSALYKQAKIFWHLTGYGEDRERYPERMEHFGITTVEAMSYGTVPVVIKMGGQTETVASGINGYLFETEEELIRQTNALIRSDNQRKAMAQRAVDASIFYSVENFYNRAKAIFDDL